MNSETFSASTKRYLLFRLPVDLVGTFAFVFVLTTVLNSLSRGQTSPLVLAGTSVVCFLLLDGMRFMELSIRVTNSEVATVSRWAARAIKIPLQKVDVARSRQSNLTQLVLGRYEIQATDGKKIPVDRLAFSKDQYEQILSTIESKQKLLSAEKQGV